MRDVLKGILIGISLASILSVGVAWALDEDGERRLVDGLIGEINKLVTSQCQVNVTYGHPVSGDRCSFRDEVVTGIREGVIYCSKVSVDCFHQDSEQPATAKAF